MYTHDSAAMYKITYDYKLYKEEEADLKKAAINGNIQAYSDWSNLVAQVTALSELMEMFHGKRRF